MDLSTTVIISNRVASPGVYGQKDGRAYLVGNVKRNDAEMVLQVDLAPVIA